MKITKKQQDQFDLLRWKHWVLNPKENHFFFFCEYHMPLVMRKELDGQGGMTQKHVCDFPGCEESATNEYFPNLLTSLKIAEEDRKFNRFYELDPVTNEFVKVKNYGKRIQLEAVSKKRSKKAKLPLSRKK